MMKRSILILLFILTSSIHSNPINNAYSWVSQEYKNFRTYPRVNKAQTLLKSGKREEAKKLLRKSLEIDSKNKNAINLLLNICIEEQDELCIEKYSKKSKNMELGYFYKKKAEKEKENRNYKDAIKFSKKALNYKLKKKDMEFVELILFESYLKSNNYNEADKLINREQSNTYTIFKWSKISNNIQERDYAYSLAKELPNKLEYLKWKIELLLEGKHYTKASKELEILNKIEPTDENKKQLLYLYSITGQNNKLIKDYKKKLKKGCNRYALKALLYHYKNNRKRKVSLLEKYYPFNCLKREEKLQLSMQLIEYLKPKRPKKAKRISREISSQITNQKDLINLYQNSGQTDKLVKIYRDRLRKGCDEYSLYFLLEHYKKSKKNRKKILEKSYPYSCLPTEKQATLSLELINLLDKSERDKTESILRNLNKNSLQIKDFLYLSNLESSLGNYQKSIEYANSYLQHYPNNIDAIKNIGYLYFKLDKKNSAVHYLIQASKLAPNDYKLLKNIGFLCIDLKEYDTASYYWNIYLNKNRDKEVSLELASLYYYNLNKPKEANRVLKKYEKLTKNYSLKYYTLKAKVSHNTESCKKRLNYYKKALNLEKNRYLQYEQIHLLQQCNQESKALTLMQKFVNSYPNNLQYKKELAYMYSKNRDYKKAILNLKEIKEREPKNVKNYTTLAYTHKKIGQKKEAIDIFKEAIDRSKNMNQQQRQNIKHEITYGSKDFHFYLAQSARLNSYKQGEKLSPVNSASYNGFGTIKLSYQPTFLPKSTTLYANIIHNHKNVQKSIQPSIGVRYKPLKEKEIYLSAEQLIKSGSNSRSDTLLRASLGISGNPNSYTHENLYVESAYFTKSDATILYGNYEYGKKYKTSQNINITPYLTTGVTYNNDNNLKKSVTKMDVGVGVAVDILSGETEYEIGKYKNKLKLEARQKYAGNSKDKQALQLQWEFSY